MRLLVLALAFALLVVSIPASAEPTGVDVEIVAPDGLMLRATYWEATAPGPGVLLMHQCNRDRHAWDALARQLAEAGVHALAFDFRGFGESVGDGASFREQGEALWPLFEGDVDRALDFLLALPKVDKARIGTIGASCGGSQVLLLCNRNESVKSVVLLSSALPWISEEDVTVFEKTRRVALLGIAADGDKDAAAKTRRIFGSSRHAASRMLLYKGDLHGVPLFEQDPGLIGTIVDFLARNL